MRFARGSVDVGRDIGRFGTMNSDDADAELGGTSVLITDCPSNDVGMPTNGWPTIEFG